MYIIDFVNYINRRYLSVPLGIATATAINCHLRKFLFYGCKAQVPPPPFFILLEQKYPSYVHTTHLIRTRKRRSTAPEPGKLRNEKATLTTLLFSKNRNYIPRELKNSKSKQIMNSKTIEIAKRLGNLLTWERSFRQLLNNRDEKIFNRIELSRFIPFMICFSIIFTIYILNFFSLEDFIKIYKYFLELTNSAD